MQAGQLSERITLQLPAAGEDAAGQPVAGWTDIATVWADVRHLSGLESIKADAPVSTLRASIRIRYLVGVTAGMRVLHRGTAYNILAPLVNRQQGFIDLPCEAVNVV